MKRIKVTDYDGDRRFIMIDNIISFGEAKPTDKEPERNAYIVYSKGAYYNTIHIQETITRIDELIGLEE